MTVDYILTVFITIITVVDPLGIIPVFLPIANKFSSNSRNQLIIKSTLIAFLVGTIFLILGKILFYYLKIEFYSLNMVGGILLFVVGLQMVRSDPRQTISNDTILSEVNDVAVFPLAIPMLSGPGTIDTLLMFVSKNNEVSNYLLIFSAMVLSFVIAALVMKYSEFFSRIIGKTGMNIIDKVMGIILCALAVQFIANSMRTYIQTLS